MQCAFCQKKCKNLAGLSIHVGSCRARSSLAASVQLDESSSPGLVAVFGHDITLEPSVASPSSVAPALSTDQPDTTSSYAATLPSAATALSTDNPVATTSLEAFPPHTVSLPSTAPALLEKAPASSSICSPQTALPQSATTPAPTTAPATENVSFVLFSTPDRNPCVCNSLMYRILLSDASL